MASVTSIAIVATFSISLFLSAYFIGYFINEQYGDSSMMNGITLPNSLSSYSQSQDFRNDNGYNKSVLKVAPSDVIWTQQEGVGLALTKTALISITGWSYVFIDNIKADSSGTISNTYKINNSVTNILGLHPEYGIVVKDTGSYDGIHIVVKDSGLVVETTNHLNNVYFDYPHANQITNPTITTTFNDNDHMLDIVFNGNTYHVTNLPPDSNPLGLFSRYYGGVFGNDVGFTLVEFSTSNQISSQASTDVLTQLSSFFYSMFNILVWTVDPKYSIDMINTIFIRTQEAILFIGLVAMFRGV